MNKFLMWLRLKLISFFEITEHRTFRFILGSDKQFINWAFGELNHNYRYPTEYMDSWNDRHGDKYIIKPEDNVLETIRRLREIYRSEIDGNHTDSATTTPKVTY